jgi:glutamate carboxypeptidase
MERRFEPYLSWIDGQRNALRERVMAWAGINSGTGNLEGLRRLASVLVSEFGRLGGELQLVDLPPAEEVDSEGQVRARSLGQAIGIIKRPRAPVRVLLAIHYDTVYGEDHPFQQVTAVDERTLRGPGAADAKGGLAVLLTAVEALERSEFAERIGWEILLNPDEEIGSPGSAALFSAAARRNQVGLVFEPCLPDGALVGARKGSGNFTAIITGRSAHAGRDPQQGRNAIHALAEFVVGLNAGLSAMAGVTINVGRIEGGGPVNVVPALAIAKFNVRVDTADQQRAVEEHLQRSTDEFAKHDGIALRIHGNFTAPPKPLDGRTLALFDQVAACGRELGLNLQWRPSGGVCDGNRLAAAGLPTVDTLGPRGGNLHSAGEYLLVDSLVERAKLAALVLMRLAAGPDKQEGAP